MLSRRNMIKALLTSIVGLTGGLAVWTGWRRSRGATPPAEPAQPITAKPADPAAPAAAAPVLSFFLLSDIHMTTDNDGIKAKLHTALKDITRFDTPVEALVLGGDLVDGGRDQDYRLLREIFSGYKLPKHYANMGNHEYYGIWYNAAGEWATGAGPNDGKKDADARQRFTQFMGYKEPYSDAWVNGVHLIMVSQEAYVQERPEVGEGAWYSDQQLAWLEETMKQHADGRPALVFIHQPLPPDGEEGGSHRLIRAKEFRRILAPYRNVLVFSGHTHWNLEQDGHYVKHANFHWFTNASVGKTRGNGSVAAPVQGMYVQVYPDRVVVRGREFSNRTWIKAADWTVQLV